MDVMGPKGAEWTISQLVNETAYSYQAVHKVLQMIVEEGFATKNGRTFKISTRGKLKCVAFFFAALRRADIRTLKVLFEMAFFHNPPPQ
jgi:DNA-binding IclR family transcriptional regulator